MVYNKYVLVRLAFNKGLKMQIRITSHRGDHCAVLEDIDAKLIYDKLTGKIEEPLPKELKQRCPDTFEELQVLWTHGKINYMPVAKKDGKESLVARISDFDPNVQEMTFIAPIVAG